MPANTSPIYSIAGHIESGIGNNTGYTGSVLGTTANTALTGAGTAGTDIYKIFTAGTNGSYVQKIRFRPVGSPAATVARIFISNNATNSATATWLYDEITLPAVTLSQTAASSVFELPLNFALPTGQYLFLTFGTSTGASGTGYSVVTIAGDY